MGPGMTCQGGQKLRHGQGTLAIFWRFLFALIRVIRGLKKQNNYLDILART
jgi:hypothetical protein